MQWALIKYDVPITKILEKMDNGSYEYHTYMPFKVYDEDISVSTPEGRTGLAKSVH
jgi:hypothetical protein